MSRPRRSTELLILAYIPGVPAGIYVGCLTGSVLIGLVACFGLAGFIYNQLLTQFAAQTVVDSKSLNES